jgi:hypothetical protein
MEQQAHEGFMSYADFDMLGVFIAPFVPMAIAAGLVTLPLLRLADHFGVTRQVWHPPLFNSAIYLIVLSLIVIGAGAR